MPTQPAKEQPFEQEICAFFNHNHGLGFDWASAVTVTPQGQVWAGNALGVFRLEGERWRLVQDPSGLASGNAYHLAADKEGALWVGSCTGVARLKEGQWQHWYGEGAPTRDIRGLVPDGKGGVWALMSHEGDLNTRDVWHFDGKQWRYWEVGPGPRMDPTSIALDGKGRPYIVLLGKVLRLRGKRWSRVNLRAGRAKALAVAGAPDGSVWVGSTDGVIVLRDGAPQRTIGKAEGMPVAAAHGIAFAPNGDVWFSHGVAASRMRGSEWRYYSPHTWFPGDRLHSIAFAPDGAVWLAASRGIGRIETRVMTLEEKSRHFDRAAVEQHVHLGLIHSLVLTEADNPDADWRYYVTDNDGSNAGDYCASQCFRYAVTKDEEARRNARECLDGLIRLVRITGIRGLPARAVFRKDDKRMMAVAGEWHESSDGEWLWKGDTSSDEIDDHMFTYGVYCDLVANEEERRLIASTVSDLVGGIVENGYVLRDVDGKRTRWGVWAPELLNGDEWEPERRLNSMEILSYLRTALHVTGDSRFDDAYNELVEKHGYVENVRNGQMATPPHGSSKFDDDLAVHAYYPLIKYETKPELRAIYLESMARFWEFVRPERNPFMTAMCNACLGRADDADVIMEVLSGYRLDRAARAVVNEVRQDLQWHTVEGVKMLTRPLPGAERAHYEWDHNSCRSERAGSPNNVLRPTPFLMAYWMARYHGLIAPA